MICPNCSTSIPDGVLRCPACHADLAATTMIPRLQGRWCPSCGALVPDGRETCPSCGMLVPVSHTVMPRHGSSSEAWVDLDRESSRVRELESEHLNEGSEGQVEDDDAQEEPEAVGDSEAQPAAEGEKDLQADENVSDEEDQPSDENYEEGVHGFVPHLNSAIPMGEDRFGIDARQERIPRTAAFLVAAAASLVVIGGTTLLITRPWDPASFETRASEQKDVSQAGYPGEHLTLIGQDSGGARAENTKTSDQEAYESVSKVYERLGELRTALETNEGELVDALQNDIPGLVAGGYGEAESVSIEVGSLIIDLEKSSVANSAYAADAERVKELAGWLNSWASALLNSWKAMSDAYMPSYAEQQVMDILYNGEWYGTNLDRASFNEHYESWAPVEQVTTEGDDVGSSIDTSTVE